MQTVLEFDAVSKSFGRERVLSNLSLHLSSNQVVCLAGPSGCGKTTAIRVAAGLLKPDDQGRVLWWHDGGLCERPIRPVAAVFQEQGLLPWRTVAGNVALPLEITGATAAGIRASVTQALENAGLTDKADYSKFPHELSGGMRSRVALARALVVDSPLMLMDEPLAHLDTFSREEILPIVLRLARDSARAVLYVTHDLEEAAFVADAVVVFGDAAAGQFRHIEMPTGWHRRPELRRCPDFQSAVQNLREAFRE